MLPSIITHLVAGENTEKRSLCDVEEATTGNEICKMAKTVDKNMSEPSNLLGGIMSG